MLMHQLVQGYQFPQIRKISFLVFINFPSVSKDQALEKSFLTLFCPVFSFQLVHVAITHHNIGKDVHTQKISHTLDIQQYDTNCMKQVIIKKIKNSKRK